MIGKSTNAIIMTIIIMRIIITTIIERNVYLMTHSTHFIYGYMASDIWLRTILIVRKETCCPHIGYSYRLAARVLLYASSHRQDNTYHCLCYTSRGALAGTRIAQWVHPMKDRSDDPPHHEQTLYLCDYNNNNNNNNDNNNNNNNNNNK